MKKIIILICCFIFWELIPSNINGASLPSNYREGDSIYIYSSPELLNITTTWVNGYSSSNPDVKWVIQSLSAHSTASEMQKSGHIAIVFNNDISDIGTLNSQKKVVARDIIVPIMNADNPYKDEIFKHGVSASSFSQIYAASGPRGWGVLLNNNLETPITSYRLKDLSGNLGLEAFLKTESQRQYTNTIVLEAEDLINEIQNNPYAIGFCKFSQIIDPGSNDFKTGIVPIPIDVNENNRLDYIENIYDSPAKLARGVWIGKYPHTLYRNIFALIGPQSMENREVAFLEWIINEGQSSLSIWGFSELIPSEKARKLRSIYYPPVAEIESNLFSIQNLLYLLFAILVLVFIFFTLNSFVNKRQANGEDLSLKPSRYFNEKSILAPRGLFFDKHHTWVFMEKKGLIRVGIDDFLQHTVGNITKVKMRKAGTRVERGDPLISIIQRGKKLEIHSPITGMVQENNEKLIMEPSLINKDPYNEGWVTTLHAEHWLKETKYFAMAEKYKAELKKEFSRLKDFLIFISKQEGYAGSPVILQEGGELKEAPLEQLGPEAWEEFQIQFLNRMGS